MRARYSEAIDPQIRIRRRATALLAIGYPLLMIASVVLKPAMTIPGAMWPPIAVAFSAFYLLPRRAWPLIALLILVDDVLIIPGITWMATGTRPSVPYAMTISCCAVLIAAGMAVTTQLLRRLRRERESPALIAPALICALCAGALPGAVFTAVVHAARAHLPLTVLDVAVRVLSAVLAVVALSPLLFGVVRGFDEPQHALARSWEAPLIVVCFMLLGLYCAVATWPFDRYLQLMLLAVPLLWLSLRLARRAVALAAAILAIGITIASAHGIGMFPPLVLRGAWQDGILSTQIFLLIACGEALLINWLILEQRALLFDADRKQAMLLAYAQALDKAEESVRRATALDLHDGVAQIIAGQGMILGAMRRRLGGDSPLCDLVDQALAASQEAQSAVRATIQDLSPPEIERASLVEIVNWVTKFFAARYHFDVSCQMQGDPALAIGHLRLIYRVLRELVYNSYKHSQADSAQIRLVLTPQSVEIVVLDTGIGFEQAAPLADGRARYGLVNLADRVRVAGGRIGVESAPGKGCRVTVELPLSVTSFAEGITLRA
jgi:signal transduction histidine kinase